MDLDIDMVMDVEMEMEMDVARWCHTQANRLKKNGASRSLIKTGFFPRLGGAIFVGNRA